MKQCRRLAVTMGAAPSDSISFYSMESEVNKATSLPRSGVKMPKYRSNGEGGLSVPHCVPTLERGNDSRIHKWYEQ